jgi:DNA-binding MarR family transcriptional regulator
VSVRHEAAAPSLGIEDAQRLQQALGRIARRLRSRTSDGLTPSQLTCLGAIVKLGPVRVSDVAAREGINPTALSRVIARLDEAELIVRTPDPNDRRSAMLAATRKGRRTLEHVHAERTKLLLERVGGLDVDDARALAAALPALAALAESLDTGTA